MTVLRFDRADLDGTTMVIPPSPTHLRERSRTAPHAPLGYLYEHEPEAGSEPPTELRLNAGHYDAERHVWVFSGDITAVTGLTTDEPPHPA